MRAHFRDVPLVIDAGIGALSQAMQAMEMGFDAVLLNTAVAKAMDPVAMGAAFGQAVSAGFSAYGFGLIPRGDVVQASTPILGLAELARWCGLTRFT